MLKRLLQVFVILLPWPVRRVILDRVFGYRLHPTARIGLSWIYPDHLVMEPGATIGHFNVAIHLNRIEMGANSIISNNNWITGYSRDGGKHFTHQEDRDPSLLLGEESAITKLHHFDCTNRIEIGAFTTIAGYRSQFLTHSIDLALNRQDSAPIRIGAYCLLGTDVVVLGGATLPDHCVLGAKSLLRTAETADWMLYSGVPVSSVRPIDRDAAYFRRESGMVE
jgi:acetyltransferase-like isoleucine patch superfamily enzyme